MPIGLHALVNVSVALLYLMLTSSCLLVCGKAKLLGQLYILGKEGLCPLSRLLEVLQLGQNNACLL